MPENNKIVRALIVDDEVDICELIGITLSRMAIQTVAAPNMTSAFEALRREPFDLCLTDMHLPDGSGIDVVTEISRLQPACPVAVITAFGSTDTAVASLKAGAFDFVSKPIDISALRRLVNQALKLAPAPATSESPSDAANSATAAPRLVGETPAMCTLRQTIAKLARSQAPVYIAGESGTGKELVARSIHAEGPRVDATFVPVNCGAIPTDLMEAEFFGYRKGAFTGADRDYQGLVARAEGGTLFLDEIADLPLSMQVKLLRVIQERSVRRLGEAKEQPVDMRIICATHRDLAAEVASGNFREDLFYRLNVIEINVPPLRERIEDIPMLAELILSRLAEQLQLRLVPSLSNAAIEALRAHCFPGNIRELQNILERAVTLSDTPIIEPELLRLKPRLGRPTGTSQAPMNTGGIPNDGGLEGQLEALERQRIEHALASNRFNKTQTAKALGITFRALRYRMEKLEIE